MTGDEKPPTDPVTGKSAAPGPLLRLVRNQKVVFLAVGGFNTLLATVWFIGWQLTIGDTLGYHAAIVLGYLCNVATAFATNRYLVFRVRGHVLRDLWRFLVVNSGAFAVNLVAMTVAVSVLGFPPIPSQLVITFLVAGISFFGYRDFSFRRTTVKGP